MFSPFKPSALIILNPTDISLFITLSYSNFDIGFEPRIVPNFISNSLLKYSAGGFDVSVTISLTYLLTRISN